MKTAQEWISTMSGLVWGWPLLILLGPVYT